MGKTVKENEKKNGLSQKIKGLKSEFKKIIWLDKATLTKQTVTVLVISVLLSAITFVVDFVARIGIEFLVK